MNIAATVAAQHGLTQDDVWAVAFEIGCNPEFGSDGWWGARPMPHPIILYRSVSIPELIDVLRSGLIRGGGNRFSGVDNRPYVFFADEFDDRLLRQGEATRRQAHYAAQSQHAWLASEFVAERLSAFADLILTEFERDGIWYDPAVAPVLRNGEGTGWFRRAGRRHDRKKYDRLFRYLRQLKRVQVGLWSEYDCEVARIAREIDQRKAIASVTSAVLVTRPIAGGLLYSIEFGMCGLGDREYGFQPGQILLADIEQIVLVKAGQEVVRCSVSELVTSADLLAMLVGPSQPADRLSLQS